MYIYKETPEVSYQAKMADGAHGFCKLVQSQMQLSGRESKLAARVGMLAATSGNPHMQLDNTIRELDERLQSQARDRYEPLVLPNSCAYMYVESSI